MTLANMFRSFLEHGSSKCPAPQDLTSRYNRPAKGAKKLAQVKYIVDGVDEAVAFYVSQLGFKLEQQYGPAIAILVHGDLKLWVAGPKASASRPMPDGAKLSPGGWSRFVLTVDDLESLVSKLTEDGVKFRNEIVEQGGRKQILCIDPSGNLVELFQPA